MKNDNGAKKLIQAGTIRVKNRNGKIEAEKYSAERGFKEIEHGISGTKDTFAQCKCSLPLSRRKDDHRFFTSGIDTSIFADQPKAERREALKALAWPKKKEKIS